MLDPEFSIKAWSRPLSVGAAFSRDCFLIEHRASRISEAGSIDVQGRGDCELTQRTQQENPFQNPPPFEKLVGDLSGAYARRINIQRRLVYQVLEKEKIVKVLRMWAHYD